MLALVVTDCAVLQVYQRVYILGRGAVTVDLVVHQDVPNTDDGTHEITYLITILSKRNEWNIQQLETKFRQILSQASIPSLVVPDTDSPAGSFTNPPTDTGVRSFVFYDDINLNYTTETQLSRAVEAIRQAWLQVLGANAVSVQVSIYENTVEGDTHAVSYTIMFSSNNQTEWNFDDLHQQFTTASTGIQGNGFSVVAMNAQGRSDESGQRHSHHLGEGSSHWSTHRSSGAVKESSGSSMDGSVVYNYFLSDAIKLEFSRSSDLSAVLDAIKQLWMQVLGNFHIQNS